MKSDFGFDDLTDSTPDGFLAVKITTLPDKGTLTFNGLPIAAGSFVSVVDINAGKLKFVPLANSPTSADTIFTFQVQDDGGTANGAIDLDQSPGTMYLLVNKVNDAPVGTDRTVTTLESQAHTFSLADFPFTDADSPSNSLLSVKITTLPEVGVLTVDGLNVELGSFILESDIAAGKLKFTPEPEKNGASYASFKFQVRDNGGVLNGGIDLDPTARTMTIAVTPINDAPSGTAKTITMLEDKIHTFTVADFGFTDPIDTAANAFKAAKITTIPVVGSLTNNGVVVTAGSSVLATDITTGKLKFTPVSGKNGANYASFKFQVQDDGGTLNGGVDLDPTARLMTLTVTPLNDAPIGTSKTITMLEDKIYTFTVADFGFSDLNDSPANTLKAVKITTIPLVGSLTNNGVAVTAGSSIVLSDIVTGKLKFTPVSGKSGANYASFKFQVQDNGGTLNGGVDLDPTARLMTLAVTPVNDAPSGLAKTVTMLEDKIYTFTVADFGFSDLNDSPANTLMAVKITTIPLVGSLTNNGVAVTAGTSIVLSDILTGKLKFTPVSGKSGANYASLKFQVQDNGGVLNGGVDLDPTARLMTLAVTSVNDAPSGLAKTVTMLEDKIYTFTVADFGFTDLNDSPANTLKAVKITTIPLVGSLTNNGVAVTAGSSILLSDILTGKLKFTPVSGKSGANYASFKFQVQDNGGVLNGGVDLDPTAKTMTIAVTPINDAPSGTAKTVTMLEDKIYTFTVADFGFTDPNDTPANTLMAVKITTIPLVGSLTNNGVAVTAGSSIVLSDILTGKLKFTPVSGKSGASYASFKFQVQDNGGVLNGGVDLDPTARVMTLAVTSVNDAPSGTAKTVTMLEDKIYTFTVADFGFTDLNDSPANSLKAVKITTIPAVGSLTNNGVAVAAGSSVLATDIAAGKMKFTPVSGKSGANYASFKFQVQDNGGVLNGGVDLDPTARLMTLAVTPVNDAPSGTAKTVTMLEDKIYTFTVADFGFTDPNDTPANTLMAVKITTIPLVGSLTNNGVAVTAGTSIVLSDILTGKLKFTPVSGKSGANYASFKFQVQDNGGVLNGGVDLDPTARVMTLAVTSVNDAPSGLAKTVTMLEDKIYTFTVADFGFTDLNDSPANTLKAVKITTIPLVGSLTNNGVAVTAGSSIVLSDILTGKLKFTPVSGKSGANYASFKFQVQDNGGVLNGGVDLDPTARLMTIAVTPVNDAPSGTAKTVTMLQDKIYTFTVADFGFSDLNDSPANTLKAVKITTIPLVGSLTNNGVAVTAGSSVLATDIATGMLKFTPVSGKSGTNYASFKFQVQDNGGVLNGGVDLDPTARLMTIAVTPAASLNAARTFLAAPSFEDESSTSQMYASL